jgi:hypothetical protein
MSPTRELSLDFRGAPSTAYEVMKSPDLSTFDSFSPPMMETTDPAGKATVVIPSSEIQEDAQFFRIETAQ